LAETTPRKIALVTGADSGIGRTVALGLLEDDWAVVLAGRRAEPLQALAAEAEARGQTAMAVPNAQHVADAVRHIAAMPLSANVLNMTVMASTMPLVGRG